MKTRFFSCLLALSIASMANYSCSEESVQDIEQSTNIENNGTNAVDGKEIKNGDTIAIDGKEVKNGDT